MKMDSCCCGNKIKKEKKGRKPKRFHLAKILVLMQFKTKLLLLFEVNMPTFFYYLCSIIIHHLKTAVTEEMCQVFKSFRNSHLF